MKWIGLTLLMFVLFFMGCQGEVVITSTPPVPSPLPTSTPAQVPSPIPLSDTDWKTVVNNFTALLENDPALTALADKRCKDREAYSRGAAKYLGWDSELLSKAKDTFPYSSLGIGGSIRTLEASECYDIQSVTNKLAEWSNTPFLSDKIGLGYWKGYVCLVYWAGW